MDAISSTACECVPMFAAALGVAAISGWRQVAYAVQRSGNAGTDWHLVTDRAEQAIHLCRWIYSGAAEHAFGNPR
jgi:hypothetical protein